MSNPGFLPLNTSENSNSHKKKGEEISLAFKDHWAFPLPAYEMIVTGEKTGKLADMMEQVSSYYSSLHRSAIMRLKSLIEPIIASSFNPI